MQEVPQEILNIKSYHHEIEETIPWWEPILFPIPTREAAYKSLEITSTDGYEWSPFGKERRDELKMIENSTFYYQLKTNGYTHTWKVMYNKVNVQCIKL